MNKTQLSQRVHELDGSSGIVRVNCSVSRPAAGPEGCIAKPYAVWCSSFLRIRNRLINAQVANSRLALPNFSFIHLGPDEEVSEGSFPSVGTSTASSASPNHCNLSRQARNKAGLPKELVLYCARHD
jgi:hypothetical protein